MNRTIIMILNLSKNKNKINNTNNHNLNHNNLNHNNFNSNTINNNNDIYKKYIGYCNHFE